MSIRARSKTTRRQTPFPADDLLCWGGNNNNQKPQVMGRGSADMRMFPLRSEEEVASFPLTKWKIPEPSEELVLSREDGVTAGDIDIVVVPGVAFDSSCNRLGHGRGHYGEVAIESRAGVAVAVVKDTTEQTRTPSCLGGNGWNGWNRVPRGSGASYHPRRWAFQARAEPFFVLASRFFFTHKHDALPCSLAACPLAAAFLFILVLRALTTRKIVSSDGSMKPTRRRGGRPR